MRRFCLEIPIRELNAVSAWFCSDEVKYSVTNLATFSQYLSLRSTGIRWMLLHLLQQGIQSDWSKHLILLSYLSKRYLQVYYENYTLDEFVASSGIEFWSLFVVFVIYWWYYGNNYFMLMTWKYVVTLTLFITIILYRRISNVFSNLYVLH